MGGQRPQSKSLHPKLMILNYPACLDSSSNFGKRGNIKRHENSRKCNVLLYNGVYTHSEQHQNTKISQVIHWKFPIILTFSNFWTKFLAPRTSPSAPTSMRCNRTFIIRILFTFIYFCPHVLSIPEALVWKHTTLTYRSSYQAKWWKAFSFLQWNKGCVRGY